MAHVLDIERGRQDALDRLYIVDTRAEDAYDDIARLAQMLCGTPIALVSLVDRDRQWFKARVGTLLEWIPREISFCDHTIRQARTLIVSDALADPRFRDNALVTGDPSIRQAQHAVGRRVLRLWIRSASHSTTSCSTARQVTP